MLAAAFQRLYSAVSLSSAAVKAGKALVCLLWAAVQTWWCNMAACGKGCYRGERRLFFFFSPTGIICLNVNTST